jgi:hypothetical protein
MVCPVSDSQFVLAAPEHQVAIFDATNSTEERRKYLIERFHGRVQYLFIESICNDEATLKRNTELKLKYSPDYGDVDPKQVQPLAWSFDLEYTFKCVEVSKAQSLIQHRLQRDIHHIELLEIADVTLHNHSAGIAGFERL